MKKILVFIIVFLLFPITSFANIDVAPNAKSALLIEINSNKILYEKNINERLSVASMTKIMSMLLIMEEIKNKKLSWNEKITASANASGMGGSQIFLETNEQMTVEELFKGIAVASANDATVALAERIGGTESNFVNMMNNKAQQLNLKNTHFMNSTGLDEDNHYSSSYDISIIARELIVKYPEILKYSSIYEDYLRVDTESKFWLVNTNKLLRFYQGVDGLKTGYTPEAMYCLTATALKNDMRLIAIVLGEKESKVRNEEIVKMLDYGYNQYANKQLIAKNTILGKIKIEKANKKYIEISPKENVNFIYKKGDNTDNITYNIKTIKVKAPLKKGDKVGEVIVKDNNKIINKVDIITKEDVKKANIFDLYNRNLREIFTGDINF
jgi:serine-type D-Ala-D-Ala carboxypeptidase (penicillin-binding protein 5/6)